MNKVSMKTFKKKDNYLKQNSYSSRTSKFLSKISLSAYFCVFLFLGYAPILVMIVMSFSSGKSVGSMNGFSTIWYTELFNDSSFLSSILVSIIVSTTATFFALIIGTLAAIGLNKNSNRLISRYLNSITNYPIFAAEIVLGVSLMVVYLALGIHFGMGTLIISHILFTTPYVIISVLPRLKNIDPSLIDASFDLGAKTFKTLKNVIIPNIKGAMFVGASIAFAISFDDFIISYLTSGSVENVSTHIYSIKRITPIVYAFGTILVLVVTSIFTVKILIEFRKDRITNWEENIIVKEHKKLVKEEYRNIISLETTKMSFVEKQKLKSSISNDYDLKIIAIKSSKETIDKMRGKYEH